ncbi:hypothetical protein Pogu_2459 [Pyrobaculum oguniense TE7]|uniref:Uncharacterized protein n=1 Tax=Pyrobaculum oguniense (strain DSM 13380 / JCM 10595 / TE7) TaxID=698757 RepID=H6QDL5_PYROT|nr:hypothetical protein Pogu_2459 [Pyrobaculum oguniense TE7]
MLYYGRPEELLRAVEQEMELLNSLINYNKKLDNFIKRKINILKECILQIKRLPPGEYQLIALNDCELVPLV